MNLRLLLAPALVVAFAFAGASAASAADLDCADIGHPVQVAPGDPNNLDRDGNGIGCESQPGAVVPEGVSEPAPAAGPSAPSDELAATGAAGLVQSHPVRSMGAAGSLVVLGAAGVAMARRRTSQ